MQVLKKPVVKILDRLGYEIRRKPGNDHPLPFDMEADKQAIINRVRPYTMTSPERIYGLIGAVDYVCAHKIPGDFVECGVWRGGSMLAASLRLQERGEKNRTLWLYDTFAGMPAPDAQDVSRRSGAAAEKFEETKTSEDSSDWCAATLDDVKATMKSGNYPADNIRYIEGKVEDTIPASVPDKIALLRLDTDWYASTKHELEHLYDRLVPGGVLIIDDYGHWEGCRQAVDEYFEGRPAPMLVRVDYTGRVAIKPTDS